MKTLAKKPAVKESLQQKNSYFRQIPPLEACISPFTLSPFVIQRKATCACDGGCPRCVATIQPKLTIGQPNDKYEQEADRIADEVMRMPEPTLQRQTEEDEEEEILQTKPITDQITPFIQRQVEEEEEEEGEEEQIQASLADGALVQRQEEVPEEEDEEEHLQAGTRSAGPDLQVGPQHESQIRCRKDSGRPLSEAERDFFEPHFGRDFGDVRMHTGPQAAKTAQAVHARAFAIGRNVVFGSGQYGLGTLEGRRLLAHELAHVIQQRAAGRPLVIQRQPVRGGLASQAELDRELQITGSSWRTEEGRLSTGTRRPFIGPFIHGGLMVSGEGYIFGIRFSSNCTQSLVQTVRRRREFFGAGGRTVSRRSGVFVELFRVERGRALGVDVHSHSSIHPGAGVAGATSRCIEKEFTICCGNLGGRTVPPGRRSMTRRYRPGRIRCQGPSLAYRIIYCTNGRDFSLRVPEFSVDVSSVTGPRMGLLGAIAFTGELLSRLDRHGIYGTREVQRHTIINPAARQFVQDHGANGAEALFYARGNVRSAQVFLRDLTNVRQQYETCLAAVINRPQRTPQRWSEFVRRQLAQPGFGLCRSLTRGP